MCAILKRLASGEGPLWATWQGRRLLLAAPDAAFLARGMGLVLVSTRRGYRRADLIGRRPEKTTSRPQLRGDNLEIIAEKRVRAVILEEHPREPAPSNGPSRST